MLADDPQFMPYPPASKTVGVVGRIHAGTATTNLSIKQLTSFGVAEGNADRVQKALRFLGLIDAEANLTDLAMRLRKATSDEYQPLLAEIVQGAYAPVFVAYPDPAILTPIDLNNAFKLYDPAGQRANMIALFMALCREAGLAPAEGVRHPRATGTKPPKDRTVPKPALLAPPAQPPPPPTPPITESIIFHPAIDTFLREARKIAESDDWSLADRERIVSGFSTLLDLFLPVKK